MPFSRRNFLIASAAASVMAPRTIRAAGSRPEHLIVIIAKGGWDTTFCFDPKWGSTIVEGPEVDSTGSPGDVEDLRDWHNGQLLFNDQKRASVSKVFQDWGSQIAVIRGMWTGSIVHQPCRIRLLTGSTAGTNPDFATIFGFARGANEPIGSIDFSGLGYSGHLAASTGSVGHRSQLKALLDPQAMFQAPTWADYQLPLFQPTETEEDAIRHLIESRAQDFLLKRSDGGGFNDRRVDDLHISLDRRERLLAQGLDIAEPLPMGDEPSFALQANLAVDLLEKGLCRAVTLQHFFSWDTHKANVLQHERFDNMFAIIDTMLTDLQSRGLLEKTLVVVCSEMARTPRRNIGLGKDHWAHTSQLLIGGGVVPGIYGGTDERTESLSIDYASGEVTNKTGELFKYDNFAAGILAHLDVDPSEWYPTITPFTAATDF
jgi:hypothetical protein